MRLLRHAHRRPAASQCRRTQHRNKGLDETFQEYFKMGKTPVDSTGNELVEDLKKLNFIAEGAEEMYKKAFLIEYQRYYEARKK